MSSTPLVPEWFGCGSKIEYFELVQLDSVATKQAKSDGFKDAASWLDAAGRHASSIDKVFFIPLPEIDFCELALRHALMDIVASGVQGNQVDVCFEFAHATDFTFRKLLAEAFFAAAGVLGLAVGKCHSTFAAATALVMCVRGTANSSLSENAGAYLGRAGDVILSGALGGMSCLYSSVLKKDLGLSSNFVEYTKKVDLRATSEACSEFTLSTDVSGGGLWGAADTLSRRSEMAIELSASNVQLGWTAGDNSNPECLFANIDQTKIQPAIPEALKPLALTREFCGPLMFLSPCNKSQALIEALREAGWREPHIIGTYKQAESTNPVVFN